MTGYLILIPSLDPDEKILLTVKDLIQQGFSRFLLVNDGSKSDSFFQQLEQDYGCTVLTHKENLGKGSALKTGFQQANTLNDISYVITVDGDYQHKAADVYAVAVKMRELDEKSLVLGVRSFKKRENIPLRSWLGNKMSAFLLGVMTGKKLQDSQTGLRGFPVESLDDMLKIPGERFEYETNMLLHARKHGYSLVETPIETVYIHENESSHFHPFTDSLKVCSVMLMFLASSTVSFLVDISLFSALVFLFFQGQDSLEEVFLASVLARMVSSVVNFTLNYKSVFRSQEKLSVALTKYYSLAFVLMILSSTATGFLAEWTQLPVIMKLLVDGSLYFFSFTLQKHYIFHKKEKNL